MRRRDFIIGIAESAAAWPSAVLSQLADRVRRIGVLMNTAADDAEGQARLTAFLHGLQQLGWAVGHWGAGDADRFRRAEGKVTLTPSWWESEVLRRRGWSM